MNKKRLLSTLAIFILLMTTLAPARHISYAADDSRTFPETGKTVSSTFLDYWNTHGGLAQQGFPISEEMEEVSDTDGKTYTVQYFERAVFEKHPENAAPYDVLLSLLGSTLYKSKYNGNAPGQTASKTNPRTFPQTGKTLGGVFRTYWEKNGGLAQQGYPISNEFKEKSDTDGKTYTVQYFERAVFEHHPENAGKPSEVLLSLLGSFRFQGGNGSARTATPTAKPTATPTATPLVVPDRLTVPGWTHIIVTTNRIALFYNSKTGVVITARLEANGSLTMLQRYFDDSEYPLFGKGFTSVEAGTNNHVVMYSSETKDFKVHTVDDEGKVQWPIYYTGVEGSKVTVDPIAGILFWQNPVEKTTRVEGLLPAGYPYNIKAPAPDTSGISDDLMVFGLNRGLWYDYAPDTGLLNFLKMNDKGDFEVFAAPINVGQGVTQIVSDYHKYMVLYYKSEGMFKAASPLTVRGEPIRLTNSTKAEKDWSIVAGTQSIYMICYDGMGNIQVNYIVPENGGIAPLKTYEAGK